MKNENKMKQKKSSTENERAKNWNDLQIFYYGLNIS